MFKFVRILIIVIIIVLVVYFCTRLFVTKDMFKEYITEAKKYLRKDE